MNVHTSLKSTISSNPIVVTNESTVSPSITRMSPHRLARQLTNSCTDKSSIELTKDKEKHFIRISEPFEKKKLSYQKMTGIDS